MEKLQGINQQIVFLKVSSKKGLSYSEKSQYTQHFSDKIKFI